MNISDAQPSPVSPIVMGFDAASALQDPNKAHQVSLVVFICFEGFGTHLLFCDRSESL